MQKHATSKRFPSRVLVLLLLIAPIVSLLLVFPSVPAVHATSSVVQSKLGNCYGTTTCVVTLNSNVALSHVIVVDGDFNVGNNICLTATVSGSLFGSYTQAVHANYDYAGGPACMTATIFYVSVTSAGSETVTMTLSGTAVGNFEIGVYEVSGIAATSVHTGTGTGSPTSWKCDQGTSSVSFASGAFLLAVGNCGSATPGTGFTTGVDPSPIYDEYSAGAVSSPTTFPITGSYASVLAGAAFDPVVSSTQPVTCTVAEVGATQPTLTTSGGSVTPTTLPCDGSPHNFTINASSIMTITVPSGGATQRERIGSGYTTSTTVSVCSGASCTGASITVHVQELLTLSNCNSASVSPASPTSDSWYNYGTSLTTVNCNGVWSRSGGTGTRAISYNWNGGGNTNVLTTSAFNAGPVTMNSGETLNVNPATQYFVTLDSDATSALSSCHPTITGDGCWYDAATTANIDLKGAYGRSTSTGTGSRLTSWELDSGSVNTLLTATTFMISVGSIAAPHTITTTVATQYFVTAGLGLTLSSPTISAGDVAWYDANSQVTAQGVYPVIYVVSSPLWMDQVSSLGIQLVTNGSANTITYGSLVLTFSCAKCAVQLFVPSSSGLILQTITDGGNNARFSVQGSGVSSFSGPSSAWVVYFGGATVSIASSTQTTTATTSSTTATGGLWQNLNSDPTWLITIAIAASALVVGVLVARRRGHSFREDLKNLEKDIGKVGGK